MPHLDNVPSEEVIDDDPASSTPGVDEALAGGVLRGEVAPDQGLEDGVASVGHHTAVPLNLCPQLGNIPTMIKRFLFLFVIIIP